MTLRGSATTRPHPALLRVVALTAVLLMGGVTRASTTESEAAQLALMIRQLELLERLAQSAAHRAPERARYHFDYARLHADLVRVRTSIRQYLTPGRVQPRDPSELIGQYRQEKPQP